MATEVGRYGLHWTPGKIAFLEQSRNGVNAVGVNQPSPFKVKVPRRWTCNHLIQLNAITPARSHIEAFKNLVHENTLVRFMLPIPGPGAGVIEDIDPFYLSLLLKMSSPIKLLSGGQG